VATGRLLILGAGVYQAPLIETAQQLGYEAIVVSVPGPYPGIRRADRFLPIDTSDADAVLAVAEECGIDGVVTSGSDAGVRALGRVAERLNLPGPSSDVARTCTDKALMKRSLRRAGIPTADFDVASSLEQAARAAYGLGYPVVVKPVDSSGSRGVSRVKEPAGLTQAWRWARANSRSRTVLVERYLDGREFGAQVFVLGGEVAASFVHDDRVTQSACSTPFGHSLPSTLSPDVQRLAIEMIHETVTAFGIRDCACNFDFVLVDGAPVILEVGARAGGTGLPECVSIHAGFDFYERLVRLAVGDRTPFTPTGGCAVAAQLLRSSRTGVLRSIDVPEAVRRDPNLRELKLDLAPGDPVREFQVGPDRLGHVVAVGTSTADAVKRAAAFALSISIQVANEN
jgi:biotin carboxylase